MKLKYLSLVFAFALTVSQFAKAEELQEVTITSIRDSAAVAAEQQKNADGVTNVVASDTVGKFSSQTTAESIMLRVLFVDTFTKQQSKKSMALNI